MLVSLLQVVYGVAAVYLMAGVCLLPLLHLRGLKSIDPATGGAGLFFRILITPGLITFWPLLLKRWRAAARGDSAAGSVHRPTGPPGHQRLHTLAILLLIVCIPAATALIVAQRGTDRPDDNDDRRRLFSNTPDLPGELAHRPARGVILLDEPGDRSRPFRCLAGQLSRAITPNGERGLMVLYDNNQTAAPVGLYWSVSLDASDGLPSDAVFLGVVTGPEATWLPLPKAEMHEQGYWIAYPFLTHETEHVPVAPENGKATS